MFASRHSQLFDKAGDPGTGSGGGDPAKPFTEEQQAAIGAAISGALKSEGKRLVASAVGEALKGMNWAETLNLDEAIGGKLEKLLADTEAESGDKSNAPAKPDPKVSALEAKVQELTAKLAADADERKKLVEESRAKDAKAALRSALTPLVRAEALDIAVRDLFDAQKRVTFDDQGNPLMKVRKAAYAGGSEEDVEMPLSDAAQHWIKTQEGKFFAPPPVGGGDPKGGGAPRRVNTGSDGMPRYDQPATTDAEKIRRAEERATALQAKYPNL
ncbi:MAG TPA: hypothetical protein VFR23_24760 [Jiangellaceae bacterium]|nr:hypothetical protein [Jiangellaceae bacterium]